MSINTTTNKFYETVNFDKGDSAKALILPSENAKADLGSTTKKYDKLYVNSIPGMAKEITRGTWRPVVRWSANADRYVRPTFPVPTVTTIEAGYERIGNRVFCFFVLRVNVSQSAGNALYSDVGGLPFEIYQRVPILDDGVRKKSTNVLGYDFTSILPASERNVYANWTDSTRRSISYTSALNAIVFYTAVGAPRTMYFYQRFSYRTR